MVIHEAGRVVGYHGLAPTAIVPNMLPRSIRTGQPLDPVPCLLLGQLATDINWPGRGIGTGLVKHTLQRCVHAAMHQIKRVGLTYYARFSTPKDRWEDCKKR